MDCLKIKHKGEIYTFNRMYSYGVHYLLDRNIHNKRIYFSYDLTFDICSSSMGMIKEYEFCAGYCVVGKTYNNIPTRENKKDLIKSTFRANVEFSHCKNTQQEFLEFCERNLYLMISTVNNIS